jgi:hypothetical protein
MSFSLLLCLPMNFKAVICPVYLRLPLYTWRPDTILTFAACAAASYQV